MTTARRADRPSAHGPGASREELAARAEQLGIDLGLLDENLRLTPTERMRQHDRLVRQILATQERLGVRCDEEP